ncbi:helix-turn-helix domain-containing protein [Psychrobacillus antarcticus]|uniref:helix-turn-helix domain-containing protein n=1 Tax=Psychrobacillus antarcticus TaxID=2879115 RepID=UPI0024086283|nr:helix-turn-helix domain-containing protein [Psychrobacillus antarcticus]
MAFEYLAEHATFKSVEDMDLNVKKHIDKYRLDLTTSERAIVFMIAGRSLMYPGASHLKAETIADKTNTSRSTVMRGIKKLISLKIIEKVTQTKLNGIKGASIYKILPYDDTSSVTQREEVVEASNDVTCPPQSEDLSIKSFNLLSSKQAKNIYNLREELALQAENKKAYMNEYKEMLFDFMNSLPMKDELKDELHKAVLATDLINVSDFIKAKNVIFKLISDIADGTLTLSKTLRSAFVGAYNKSMERSNRKTTTSLSVEEQPRESKPVKFYNWLEEVEGRTVIKSNPHSENWLLW